MQTKKLTASKLGNQHETQNHRIFHEHRTRWVVLVTALMMVVELIVGNLTGSLALMADGWHMATHVGVLGMSIFAYWYARTRAQHNAFTFGTGKVYALSGYTSSLCLLGVSLWMVFESVHRLMHPEPVNFADAFPIAVLGLFVNLLSVKLLDHAGHGHSPTHHVAAHDVADGHHHDHNLRAVYAHIMADALTSLFAIVALLCGRYFGWGFLDPVMGLVGSAVVTHWALGLCRDAARQLLDVCPSAQVEKELRTLLESIDDVLIADLHIWDLGPGRRSCVVSLLTCQPRETSFYRERIQSSFAFAHLTVETHRTAEDTLRPPAWTETNLHDEHAEVS